MIEHTDDCEDCVRHDGLCSWHAQWIAQLAQINWKKLMGESLAHETDIDPEKAIENAEHEKQKAVASSEYRKSIPAPDTPASRLLAATTGAFTGRNRKAA